MNYLQIIRFCSKELDVCPLGRDWVPMPAKWWLKGGRRSGMQSIFCSASSYECMVLHRVREQVTLVFSFMGSLLKERSISINSSKAGAHNRPTSRSKSSSLDYRCSLKT